MHTYPRDPYEQFLNELMDVPLFNKYPKRVLLDASEALHVARPILTSAGLGHDDIECLFEQALDSITHYGFTIQPVPLNLQKLEAKPLLTSECEFNFPNDLGRSVIEIYIFLHRHFCQLLQAHGIHNLKSKDDPGALYYFYELQGDCIVLEKF